MLLLLGGVVAFVAVYSVYSHALGWLDGLPQLPIEKTKEQEGQPPPPPRDGSPTIELLKIAFGPNCKEQDSQNYPTQLEFRNGESSVVLASGTPPFNNNSPRVVLSPFSLAVFGKPRPAHLRQPGEVTEISTFHADKAVLEFDRPINGPNDMNKAKLLRMELVSDPEFVPVDPRNDVIHITNNQRSADPDKHLVLRTRGPVFYRNPKGVPDPGTGPDVWTDAPVEITDKQNLPRGYSRTAPPTAPAKGDDLRQATAVGDILTGGRLPPPTVTAVGMRIFLEPEKPSTVPNSPAAKKGSAGFSGVRRVELLEKVLVNLWVDGSQTFVTDPARPEPDRSKKDKEKKGTEKKSGPLGPADPPGGAAAVLGGLMHAVVVARQLEKALLQIETLGPFAYDVERNVARFDVLPQANPSLLNDVQVTRTPARGGQHRLFSQVLEIEFNGPPTGPQPAAPGEGAPESAGPTFKQLHAWTHTPGRYLTVSAEGEELEAYGYDLVHEQDVNRTTLHGVPLYAVQKRNVLTAGSPQKAGALVMQRGPDGRSMATVYGAGRVEMVDPQTGENSITASWQTTLSQTKETVGGVELDLLTFTDGAMFEDKTADYWLKGKVLKLWLKPGKTDEKDRAIKTDGKTESGPLPHRLQAIGDVTSHSADLDIERAEHLNVLFRDVPPPPEPKVQPKLEPKAAAPVIAPPQNPGVNTPPPQAPAPAPPPPPPPEPAKPKPPMKLTARVVDTDVVRYPVKKPADAKDAKPAPKADEKPGANPAAEPSVKYELETARCDGDVVVHQDPDSPEKPRGVDILALGLVINHSPQGSIMTARGTDEKPSQVHFEGTSIIGPKVVIDQVSNWAEVEGRGSLVMPASSDLNGGDLKNPEVVVVHWRDGMEFHGARKKATFTGSVTAVQKESWVKCHLLEVTFDRPVYFNNLKKSGDPPPARPTQLGKDGKPVDPKDDNPKIETVSCTPAPEDAREVGREVWFQEVIRDETGKIVKLQHITAKELYLNASRRDERGDPYQMVMAHGPGIVRVWQAGQKDLTGPPPPPAGQRPPPKAPPAPAQPMNANKDSDSEMKLTVVTFSGRMTVKDRGKVYQEAVFTDNIQVVNVPSDDPNTEVKLRHQLPPRALFLTCVDRLTVSTYKKGDNPPDQSMTAKGNSYIRSDEYEGWGEVVTYERHVVTLHANDPERPGNRDSLARIVSRFKGTSESAKVIFYDRMTQSVRSEQSTGGTIQTPQQQPKPAPPPKQPQPGTTRPPMR
jgi:hypothetical protein